MVCSAQEMSGIQSKDEIFRNLKNAAIRGGHRGVDIGEWTSGIYYRYITYSQREIDPPLIIMKEISFTMLIGDKLNTRTLIVVLECLKHRAFHIETGYVNSLDPSRGCTLQAELIVTTSSGSDSSAMGECGG